MNGILRLFMFQLAVNLLRMRTINLQCFISTTFRRTYLQNDRMSLNIRINSDTNVCTIGVGQFRKIESSFAWPHLFEYQLC